MGTPDRGPLEAAIFQHAHAAIQDWDGFAWHSGIEQPYSSQGLAIDVLGTMKVHPQRNELVKCMLDLVFREVLSFSGSWKVSLEHEVLALNEPRPTQLDALLESEEWIVTVESKFCEAGAGSCSQPKPLKKGRHKGQRQCNGRYEKQVNPVNKIGARCALTGKDILYWTFIPQVFTLEADSDLLGDCPFRDGRFQYMRNVVAAEALAAERQRACGSLTLLLYVEGGTYPVSREVRDSTSAWNRMLALLRPEKREYVAALSYQAVLASWRSLLPDDSILSSLEQWLQDRRYPGGEQYLRSARP